MSALDLGPLLHALGLDADHPRPWRNHYVTGAGDLEIAPLVAAELMAPARAPGFLPPEDRVFVATDAGRVAAIAENRRLHPPLSRSQSRYLAWLRTDGCCGNFGEYLRKRLYERAGVGT